MPPQDGKTKVVVLGTTTVDILLSGMDRIPAVGGDEFTPESYAFLDAPIRFALGGNGASSACALARLGVPVELCSAIGNDALGALARGWLAEAGVGLRGLAQSGLRATAGTAIIQDRLRHRMSLHHPGASAEHTLAMFPQALITGARALLVTGYHLLPGFRPEGLRVLLRGAHEAGALTFLDIGPVVPPVAGLTELAPLLPAVDYLVGNSYEIAAVLDAGSPEEGCGMLLDAGARAVLVKRGSGGAALVRRQGLLEAAAFPVEAASTIGAGDTFNAAFLCALLDGIEPARALRFANAASALVVAAGRGALGCPERARVEQFLRERP